MISILKLCLKRYFHEDVHFFIKFIYIYVFVYFQFLKLVIMFESMKNNVQIHTLNQNPYR